MHRALLLLIAMFAACAPVPEPTPTPAITCELPSLLERGLLQITPVPGELDIYEDEGRICFYPTPGASFNVSLGPSGCYASYCTLVYERTGDMAVDLEARALRFSSRFVVQSAWQVWGPDASCGCAADCGGAGELRFDTPPLPDGVYGVYLGDVQIGQLTVPFHGLNRCLSSAATATTIPPTPTPTATRDPAAYPAGTPPPAYP